MKRLCRSKDCDTCGNAIPADAFSCQFCGSTQRLDQKPSGPKEHIRTVSIEAGQPTVPEAMAKLETELLRARQAGVRVVRVIHGWGSSGTGGKLRDACHALLGRQARNRQIRGTIAGEDYSAATIAGRELMGRHPDLRKSERSDSGNPGTTVSGFGLFLTHDAPRCAACQGAAAV